MDIYDKSFEILKQIARNQKRSGYKIFLVGGWAVWAYSPYMKSRDIDFLVKREDLWKLEKFIKSIGFRETAHVLEKKGFVGFFGEDKIDIDVYDKNIGKYDIGQFIKNAVSKKISGVKVNVISVSDLFMLKAYTAMERLGTAKGEKDLADLLALLDRHYKEISLPEDMEDIRKIFAIILKDYRQSSLIYHISYEKFMEIKKHFSERL